MYLFYCLENLKKYNHVFKSNNSSIEELEKIPAYKRMGIKINNSVSQDDKTFSKTILNVDNKLEFVTIVNINKAKMENVTGGWSKERSQ